VRRHQGPIYNFCLRVLGQADDAADVAQETFVQLYSHLGQLNERDALAPWLFRVARNRCIDVIRRRRTVPLAVPNDSGDSMLVLEPADEDPLPEEPRRARRPAARAVRGDCQTPARVCRSRSSALRGRSLVRRNCVILDVDEGAARYASSR